MRCTTKFLLRCQMEIDYHLFGNKPLFWMHRWYHDECKPTHSQTVNPNKTVKINKRAVKIDSIYADVVCKMTTSKLFFLSSFCLSGLNGVDLKFQSSHYQIEFLTIEIEFRLMLKRQLTLCKMCAKKIRHRRNSFPSKSVESGLNV